MRNTVKIALAAAALAVAGSAQAEDVNALMQKGGCFACHKDDAKLVGPSYKDVAAKYAGADAAKIEELANKTIKGGSGVWGPVPMPPNAKITLDEAKVIITQHILPLK
jgi:cytochrome c